MKKGIEVSIEPTTEYSKDDILGEFSKIAAGKVGMMMLREMKRGEVATVKFLLMCGADPMARNGDVFYHALGRSEDRKALISMMLEKSQGRPCKVKPDKLKVIFSAAAYQGNVEAMDFCFKKGLALGAKGFGLAEVLDTGLCHAAVQQDTGAIQWFKDQGVDFVEHGVEAMKAAFRGNSPAVVRFLLENGAPIENIDVQLANTRNHELKAVLENWVLSRELDQAQSISATTVKKRM